ncbi:hypothetical protein F0U60_14300 [Archangium minus]|uniref:Uncharacterized protein n=1 Tax=Archangium minus TaxID=83450 RepID=A0ABY9WPH5_9BACT|nr:hypothetical protein F0U60_14300 [Archangium minus]
MSIDSLIGDMFFTSRIRTELLRHPGLSLNYGSTPAWMSTRVDDATFEFSDTFSGASGAQRKLGPISGAVSIYETSSPVVDAGAGGGAPSHPPAPRSLPRWATQSVLQSAWPMPRESQSRTLQP